MMGQGSSFEVVIIGGGNAGISAAAHLIRRGVHSIAIVEPQSVHTYRPLLSYVGAGQATKRAAERMQRSVTRAAAPGFRARLQRSILKTAP